MLSQLKLWAASRPSAAPLDSSARHQAEITLGSRPVSCESLATNCSWPGVSKCELTDMTDPGAATPAICPRICPAPDAGGDPAAPGTTPGWAPPACAPPPAGT